LHNQYKSVEIHKRKAYDKQFEIFNVDKDNTIP